MHAGLIMGVLTAPYWLLTGPQSFPTSLENAASPNALSTVALRNFISPGYPLSCDILASGVFLELPHVLCSRAYSPNDSTLRPFLSFSMVRRSSRAAGSVSRRMCWTVASLVACV